MASWPPGLLADKVYSAFTSTGTTHGGQESTLRSMDPLVSPVFADLAGLPPLLVQVGSHEILLDDAVRLARQAAQHDVEVTLDVVPGVPHVFQHQFAELPEAGAALDRAGTFLRPRLRIR